MLQDSEDRYLEKGEWIERRTNNPDRLGRDVWEDYYGKIKEHELRGVQVVVSEDLEKEMVKDYLQKMNISGECLNEAAGYNLVRELFKNLGEKTDKEITTESIEQTLNILHIGSKTNYQRNSLKQSQNIEVR